ncbi:MAG: hypothetical protein ACUVX1_12240 [Chloroflexota bacterium]
MSVQVATKLREDLRGRWTEPDVEFLVNNAVDDLVKYNVVRFLYQHPATVGDASLFATALGFYSIPKTQVALEQLVTAGILNKWTGPGVGETVYGLTDDERVLGRLEKLCELRPDSSDYRLVLSVLASKSLKRAEAAAKRMRLAAQHSQRITAS